jgi:uncharacterized protein involved in exopolysaccharide biosynthesis
MRKKPNPVQAIIDKSIKELKANSKVVEQALEKFLAEEGIEVSNEEFNEIQQLTNTMDELDKVLLEAVTPKPKPKRKKKKKSTKKKAKVAKDKKGNVK